MQDGAERLEDGGRSVGDPYSSVIIITAALSFRYSVRVDATFGGTLLHVREAREPCRR